MPEVFLLGAGFSKAIHSSMPSLKELSIRVRDKFGIGRLPPPLAGLGDDIELWLTYLSQPQPWLKEYYNLQNRALFLEMTEVTGRVLDESMREALQQTCPDWLDSLITRWDNKKSSVITLNYDTLIERAARKAGIEKENIYPVPFTDVRRASGILGIEPESSFHLFKLHGSTNWYYSGASTFYGEVLYSSWVSSWGERPEDTPEGASRLAALDKVPLIVPPTSEKASYFQHETLRQIWLRASSVLDAATVIYCIGYSLPVTDLGIRFFLQRKLGGKIPLIIVNTDDNVAAHYQNLLSNSYDIDGKYSTVGAVSFVKDLTRTT